MGNAERERARAPLLDYSEPSRADIQITKRLKATLEIIDIKLLDHFIIGKGEIVSLAGIGKL